MADASDLRAHRALDDVLALRHVVTSVAQVLGVSVSDLLMRHAQEVDMASSLARYQGRAVSRVSKSFDLKTPVAWRFPCEMT